MNGLALLLRPFVRAIVPLALVSFGATLSNAPGQTNLLVNGDAETGDTAGWVDPLNHGFAVTSTTAFVYAGTFSFHAGLSGSTAVWTNELRQDVDVSGLATAIDAGGASSSFSGVGRTNAAGGAIDPGWTRLEFLNEGGAEIASYDTGTFGPFNTWVHFEDARVIPAGTRTLRVRLLGSRSIGSSTDCFFDALSLAVDCIANTYCTAKTNSLGCVPSANFSGMASVSGSTLVVGASNVLNNKNGLLFWSRNPHSAPFQGGTLCVLSPTVRTPLQSSGGNPSGNDCSGSFGFTWSSAYLVTSGLGVGDDVYCQFWSRDPASASTTGLTDAVHFRACP